jgi:hypothetical protein
LLLRHNKNKLHITLSLEGIAIYEQGKMEDEINDKDPSAGICII